MDRFPPTRHTLVQALADDDEQVRRHGERILADAYWKPVYVYVRLKWRREPDDAADLVQEFFLAAMQKEYFADFDPARARFRTFLRVCVDRHVMKTDRRDGSDRRGGHATKIPFDLAGVEERLAASGTVAHPDEVFEQEWVRALMEDSLEDLRRECRDRGRDLDHRLFVAYDLAESKRGRPTYRDLARAENVDVTTVTNRLAAARSAFQTIVLGRIRAATASPAEYRETVRSLLGELGP